MWTKSQQTAIDAHCADNLVSAAAGSGKTAVMVERIVNRVVSGSVDIDKILVVTFTNAAASELKSRLMNKIMDSLENADNPDSLNRQLVLINNASICTIDSFCLNVLRNNFFRLNLAPDFKIADNAELELIKSDVLTKIFEKYYEEGDEQFLELVDCYTKKKDDDLLELIQKIFSFTNSMPDGVDGLDMLVRKFADNCIWHDYFLNKGRALCHRAIKFYDDAISKCSFSTELENVRLLLLDEKNNFVLASKARDWDRMCKLVSNFEFGKLIFPKGTVEEDKNLIKEPREMGKAIRKELAEIFSSRYDELCEDCKKALVSLEKIVEITKEFARNFAIEKLNAGIVDFTDVEHMTLKLLMDEEGRPSTLARQLMQKYEEIYVDEYQDCNSVQEKLFSLISRANESRPNMFMVGDMKQSIYGFRGSEPELFKRKADTYGEYLPGGNYNKIVLSKNFRSRKTIIDAVNLIFSAIMSESCGQLEYTENEYLYYNEGSYEDINPDTQKTDVVLIETSRSQNTHEYIEELKGTEAEAIYVANKITEIVNSDYMLYDKKEGRYRKAKYSDIVILLRSGKEKAETFNHILTSVSIPVYCEMGENYYDTPEIVFLTSFLKIIDNPLDDVALLTVMRHPVFSFNEDDFVSIRLGSPRGYFYNSLNKYVSLETDELSLKLKNFLETLKMLYEKSKYLPTDKLLWEVIRDTDYMSYLSFLPNSELKKANVNALMSRAHDFEKTSYKGVFDFIRYIDSLKKNNKDIEGAKILSDDEDVVRIMTIHKSKGLEFPVVFLCDAFKGFNDSDITRNKVLLERQGGFGLNYYDRENRYHYELPQKKLVKDMLYRGLLSEEMRVLYVALTRPKEKLFIVGSARNILKTVDRICKNVKNCTDVIPADVVSKSGSFMEWILMAVLKDSKGFTIADVLGNSAETFTSGCFGITIMQKDILSLKIPDNRRKREFSEFDMLKIPGDYASEILSYEYPCKALWQVPSNMSVTELKRMQNRDDDIFNYYQTTKLSAPKFYDGMGEPTPAEIGTFTHLVMEKLDLTCTDSVCDIREQISNLVRDGFLTKNQAEFVNAEKIHRIFSTDVGMLMKKNNHTVNREFGFKYLMDASKLNGDADFGEKVVIQGMIDAYFQDDDGNIIIVDYKTDKIIGNVDEIKARYAPQLMYYRIALEKSLRKKVSKTYLFLLDSGEVAECK